MDHKLIHLCDNGHRLYPAPKPTMPQVLPFAPIPAEAAGWIVECLRVPTRMRPEKPTLPISSLRLHKPAPRASGSVPTHLLPPSDKGGTQFSKKTPHTKESAKGVYIILCMKVTAAH